MNQATSRRYAFTLVEVMVVISILAILISMVLYVSGGVSGTEAQMQSKHHLREINQWMQNYSSSHDSRVLPSQFDRLDEDGEDVGGVGSRLAYDLVGSGDSAEAHWINCNNRYLSQDDPVLDLIGRGTWADILWSENGLNKQLGTPDIGVGVTSDGDGISSASSWAGGSNTFRSYRYAAPDREYYEKYASWEKNPLRSVASNSHNFPRWDSAGEEVSYDQGSIGQPSVGNGLASGLHAPLGAGAWDQGMPGYFAANNFFDSRSEQDVTFVDGDSDIDREWTIGQIRAPGRSMYLVDSFAGETIGGTLPFLGSSNYQDQRQEYYLNTIDAFKVPGELIYSEDKQQLSGPGTGVCTQEVDFRYNGGESCLVLYLDGHVDQQERWSEIWDLEGRDGSPGRGIRVLELDKRKAKPLMSP